MSQLLDARDAYRMVREELRSVRVLRLRWRYRQLRRQANGSSDPARLARLAAARDELAARGQAISS